MIDAYIGLGSNLDKPLAQVSSAFIQLDEIKQTSLFDISSLYLSRPLGPKNQPPYVNAVAWIKTKLDAHELLEQLHTIENTHGRKRDGERWGARTLDLDILVYGNICIKDQVLTIPHPGIKSREFVLYPLHEVNKNLMIPKVGLISRIKSRCYVNGMARLNF
ncbi:MAG: 2-amino-4-hydroxy-6-hydroxymethyldihydropteridine diphosphokinase [Pseudomonadota bacterium]